MRLHYLKMLNFGVGSIDIDEKRGAVDYIVRDKILMLLKNILSSIP